MQGDKRTLETTPTEAEIRAWLASRYPPDFPPMRNWGGAIRMLVAEIDRLRTTQTIEKVKIRDGN